MVGRIGIGRNAARLALAATGALLLCGTAGAQLALSGNMPVAGTGIPFGATGLTSLGLSPAPAGTIGLTGNGTTCLAAGSSSSGMPGSGTSMSGTSAGMSGTSANYDGGGVELGTPLGTSAICDTTSGSGASATLTLPPSPGGASPAGIPLGSFEINNAGISPSVGVPAPSLSMPTTNPSSPTIAARMPCPITGSSMPSAAC